MSLKLCRIHLHVVLGLPAKNGVKIPSVAWGTEVKIPSVAWRTQLVPPRKNHVSSCPARKSSESYTGGVLLSATATGWPGGPSTVPRMRGGPPTVPVGLGRGAHNVARSDGLLGTTGEHFARTQRRNEPRTTLFFQRTGRHGRPSARPGQSWAWPRPPARPVARPGKSWARPGQSWARPWAWPRPPARPVARPGQSWARPGQSWAWPRPPAREVARPGQSWARPGQSWAAVMGVAEATSGASGSTRAVMGSTMGVAEATSAPSGSTR
ncbi:hypothetical protein TIFTF001_045673, partial [Ficus carica]